MSKSEKTRAQKVDRCLGHGFGKGRIFVDLRVSTYLHPGSFTHGSNPHGVMTERKRKTGCSVVKMQMGEESADGQVRNAESGGLLETDMSKEIGVISEEGRGGEMGGLELFENSELQIGADNTSEAEGREMTQGIKIEATERNSGSETEKSMDMAQAIKGKATERESSKDLDSRPTVQARLPILKDIDKLANIVSILKPLTEEGPGSPKTLTPREACIAANHVSRLMSTSRSVKQKASAQNQILALAGELQMSSHSACCSELPRNQADDARIQSLISSAVAGVADTSKTLLHRP